MPSRWEVTLAGPTDVAIGLTAPHAVVSGWLDDRRPDLQARAAMRSGHTDQAKKWAFGPLRTITGGCAGILMQIRLLDDALGDRLMAATTPGTAVRLDSWQYSVHQPTRLVERKSWPELQRSRCARAWQVRFLTPACARRGNRAAPLLTESGYARAWTGKAVAFA
jgi:hypothetical protein